MSTGTSYHFCHLLHVSKKSFWSIILYNFCHYFIHVHSPTAGADSLQETKFWCQQKCLVTSILWCKFQKNVFEVWFYTFFNCPKCHIYKEIPFIYELGKAERQRGKEIKELRNRVKKVEDTQKVQVSAIQLPPINILVHYQSQLLQ